MGRGHCGTLPVVLGELPATMQARGAGALWLTPGLCPGERIVLTIRVSEAAVFSFDAVALAYMQRDICILRSPCRYFTTGIIEYNMFIFSILHSHFEILMLFLIKYLQF